MQTVGLAHSGQSFFEIALKIVRADAAKKRRRSTIARAPWAAAQNVEPVYVQLHCSNLVSWARTTSPRGVQNARRVAGASAACRICPYGIQCKRYFSIGRKHEALRCYPTCGF